MILSLRLFPPPQEGRPHRTSEAGNAIRGGWSVGWSTQTTERPGTHREEPGFGVERPSPFIILNPQPVRLQAKHWLESRYACKPDMGCAHGVAHTKGVWPSMPPPRETTKPIQLRRTRQRPAPKKPRKPGAEGRATAKRARSTTGCVPAARGGRGGDHSGHVRGSGTKTRRRQQHPPSFDGPGGSLPIRGARGSPPKRIGTRGPGAWPAL